MQLSMQVLEDVVQLLTHFARLAHAVLLAQAEASSQQQRATQVPQVVVAAAEHRVSTPPQVPPVVPLARHLPDEHVRPVSQVPSEWHEHFASPSGQSAAHPAVAPTANAVQSNASVRNRPANKFHIVIVPMCASPFG